MFDATVSGEWYVCIYCFQGMVCFYLLFPGNGMFDARNLCPVNGMFDAIVSRE